MNVGFFSMQKNIHVHVYQRHEKLEPNLVTAKVKLQEKEKSTFSYYFKPQI